MKWPPTYEIQTEVHLYTLIKVLMHAVSREPPGWLSQGMADELEVAAREIRARLAEQKLMESQDEH